MWTFYLSVAQSRKGRHCNNAINHVRLSLLSVLCLEICKNLKKHRFGNNYFLKNKVELTTKLLFFYAVTFSKDSLEKVICYKKKKGTAYGIRTNEMLIDTACTE